MTELKPSNPEVPNTEVALSPSPAKEKTWSVGNLIYTKKGLFWLFFWLLWFDFSFMLMESMLRPILEIQLKNYLGCDDRLYQILLATIPAIINFFLNPIISIKSDRHRGPRGRRIPFLLYGAPLVCGCLVLMGFGNEISDWVHAHWFPEFSENMVSIYTFSSLFLLYYVFNGVLGTTYYYLFNDVVPREHQVKFMSFIRAASTLAGMVYGWFFMQYSQTQWGPLNINLGFWSYHNDEFWYPKLILAGAAVFYIVTATIALLKVKEPAYPPPPPLGAGKTLTARWVSTGKTLVSECFSHKLYVLYFLVLTVGQMSIQMDTFMAPMRFALGIDFNLLGKITAGTSFVFLGLILLTAGFGDRVRPLPLMVVAQAAVVMTAPVGFLFLIPGLSSTTYLWIQIAYNVTHIPVDLIGGMAQAPLGMSLMPRERYGQFAAAQSMVRMILAQFIGSIIAGFVMHWLREYYNGSDYCMRYIFVWKMAFHAVMLFSVCLLYREWIKLGGWHKYVPPPVGPVSAPATGK